MVRLGTAGGGGAGTHVHGRAIRGQAPVRERLGARNGDPRGRGERGTPQRKTTVASRRSTWLGGKKGTPGSPGMPLRCRRRKQVAGLNPRNELPQEVRTGTEAGPGKVTKSVIRPDQCPTRFRVNW